MNELRTRGVLFDLDGTLADTAPDLGGALNRLRSESGLPELPPEVLRPHTSAGARGLIGAGFGITPDDERYAALASRFLTIYETALCVQTRLFEGMGEVLTRLELASLPWGVVTNKAARFTLPLMSYTRVRYLWPLCQAISSMPTATTPDKFRCFNPHSTACSTERQTLSQLV